MTNQTIQTIEAVAITWKIAVKRLTPILAVIAQASYFGWIISQAIPGFYGKYMGGMIGGALDLSGMLVISTAVEKKNFLWTFFSLLYVVAHSGSLIYIESAYELGGPVAVIAIALLVASVLAYITLGENNLKDADGETAANQFNQMLKEAQQLQAAGMKKDKNGNIVPIQKRSNSVPKKADPVPESTDNRNGPEVGYRSIKKSGLDDEMKKALPELNRAEFMERFKVEVPKSSYSRWQSIYSE